MLFGTSTSMVFPRLPNGHNRIYCRYRARGILQRFWRNVVISLVKNKTNNRNNYVVIRRTMWKQSRRTCVYVPCVRARSQPLVAGVVALPFAPHQVVSYDRALQVFLRRVRRHDRRWWRMVERWYRHHARVARHARRWDFLWRRHLQPDAAVQRDLYSASGHLARMQLWTDTVYKRARSGSHDGTTHYMYGGGSVSSVADFRITRVQRSVTRRTKLVEVGKYHKRLI